MQHLPKFDDPNLLVGAEHFSDAGVYRLGERLAVVQSLDFFPPLVDDPFQFGQIAAANSLSDLYALGAQPLTAMNIVGFPDHRLELEVLGEILRGGAERVAAAGAVVLGGHSVRDEEIKFGLAVTGTVDPQLMFTNAGAKPGDRLVLTKPLGTGVITTAAKARRCPPATLQQAVDSMIQLNQVASSLAREHHAHAVTDITGFGLIGHAGEMALASEVTLVVEAAQVPLLPGAEELARAGFRTRASHTNRHFAHSWAQISSKLEPTLVELLFDAQTSGGLLVALAAEQAPRFVEKCHGQGVLSARVIGHVEPRRDWAVVVQ